MGIEIHEEAILSRSVTLSPVFPSLALSINLHYFFKRQGYGWCVPVPATALNISPNIMPKDYAVFASPNFDANEYANAIVSGEPYQPPATSSKSSDTVAIGSRSGVIAPMTKLAEASAKEDISMALSKLNYGIDDVDKQIRTLVRSILLSCYFLCILNCYAQVTVHHEDLLQQASEANALEGSLDGVKARLTEVEGGVEKCVSIRAY